MRGSPELYSPLPFDLRSIPARAGEPRCPGSRADLRQVYPRPCGGATVSDLDTTITEGLSPPVRGSPSALISDTADVRSIPARAGEPWYCAWLIQHSAVYPRPCGGASKE